MYVRHLLGLLPLLLLSALVDGALSQADFGWVRQTDSATMRLASSVDDWLAEFTLRPWTWAAPPGDMAPDPVRPFQSEFGRQLATGQVVDTRLRLPTITVVSLTPASFRAHLGGTTPIARPQLACVLILLAAQLQSQGPPPRPWRVDGSAEEPPAAALPIVAIDVDIAPRPAGEAVPSARDPDCESRLTQAAGGLRPTDDAKAMATAIHELGRHALVVAVSFSRADETGRRLRDGFMAQVCCKPQPRAAGRGSHALVSRPCVYFASPFLLFNPADGVVDYPRRKLAPTLAGGDGAERGALPDMFPGLGRAVADLWHRSVHGAWPPQETVAEQMCIGAQAGVGLSLDDQLSGARPDPRVMGSYEYSPIALGPARAVVGQFALDHDPAADGGKWVQMESQLRSLPASEVFILSVDSGTTEDKFVVPVLPLPVSGAWVHGAIATTATMERAVEQLTAKGLGPPPDGARPACLAESAGFWPPCRWPEWLLPSLLAIVGSALVGRLPRRPVNPVLHDLGAVMLPLSVAAIVLTVAYVCHVAPGLASGCWRTPTVMLLMLMLGLYADAQQAAADAADARTADGPDADRMPGMPATMWRWAGQLAWASACATAIIYLVRGDARAETWMWPVGLGLGMLYLLTVRHLRPRAAGLCPLPWRIR